MRKNDTALSGYAGQEPTYTLADGSKLSAGELTAKAFAKCQAEHPDTDAAAWNGETDEWRKAWIDDTLEEITAELVDNAENATGPNVLDAVQTSAARDLGRDLIEAAMAEVKVLERPWAEMTEKQQQAVYDRVTLIIRKAVGGAVRTLATQKRHHVTCELQKIAIEKGVKAVIEIAKGQLTQELTDAVGQQVVLVIGGELAVAEKITAPKAEPDQADLLSQVHLGGGGRDPDAAGGMVEHSDPED